MTWIAVPVSKSEVTPKFLFELYRSHRLVPDDLSVAVDYAKSICDDCAVIRVVEEESDEEIGTLLVTSITPGGHADVDFIPNPQHFSPDMAYQGKIRDALRPIFLKILEGHNLLRINSWVPKSRSRTKHALIACGFAKEGVMRNAVQFAKMDPEGIVILGMIPEKE